jgi:hypothetical protein
VLDRISQKARYSFGLIDIHNTEKRMIFMNLEGLLFWTMTKDIMDQSNCSIAKISLLNGEDKMALI